MTKITAHIRVAETHRGRKFAISIKPNHQPLHNNDYRKTYYPTIHFAINFDIPDDAFESASKVIAEINVLEEHLEINAETEYPKERG